MKIVLDKAEIKEAVYQYVTKTFVMEPNTSIEVITSEDINIYVELLNLNPSNIPMAKTTQTSDSAPKGKKRGRPSIKVTLPENTSEEPVNEAEDPVESEPEEEKQLIFFPSENSTGTKRSLFDNYTRPVNE